MATIELNVEFLRMLSKTRGITSDAELSRRIDVDAGNVSRVLNGKSGLSPKFIAGVLHEFGSEYFPYLFTITADTPADLSA